MRVRLRACMCVCMYARVRACTCMCLQGLKVQDSKELTLLSVERTVEYSSAPSPFDLHHRIAVRPKEMGGKQLVAALLECKGDVHVQNKYKRSREYLCFLYLKQYRR